MLSARADHQLDRLLRLFPGDARLWTMKAFSAVGDGDAVTGYARRARALLLDEETAHGIEGLARRSR